MGSAWEEFEARSKNSTGTLFAIGGVAAFAFLVFLRFYGGALNEQAPTAAATDSAAVADKNGGGPAEPENASEPATVSTPTYQSARRETRVGVFECTVNGQRVISDRPCSTNAQSRTLTVQEADPSEVAAAQQRTWALQQQQRQTYPSYQSSSTASSSLVDSNASQCAAIDNEIDQINARMRAGGYGTAEGNWLRERWHKLKNLRYELRCGRG